jgi:hypothetical protein
MVTHIQTVKAAKQPNRQHSDSSCTVVCNQLEVQQHITLQFLNKRGHTKKSKLIGFGGKRLKRNQYWETLLSGNKIDGKTKPLESMAWWKREEPLESMAWWKREEVVWVTGTMCDQTYLVRFDLETMLTLPTSAWLPGWHKVSTSKYMLSYWLLYSKIWKTN